MTAAHQLILLHSVSQELGPAQGQPRPAQQLREISLSVLLLMPHPRQHRLEHLTHAETKGGSTRHNRQGGGEGEGEGKAGAHCWL